MLDFLYSVNAKRALAAAVIMGIIILLATNLLSFSLLIIASLLVSFAIGKLGIKSIGIELVTFTAVLSSIVYGTPAGAIIGLVLMIFHIVIPQYTGAYVIWVIPEYALAAIIAGALSGGVASIGITVTVLLNTINIMLTFMVSREHLPRYLPYAFTNVIFNIILFTQAGEAILRMLK